MKTNFKTKQKVVKDLTLKKKRFSGVLNKLQKLGRTFMLPIAMLAFCGILLGIGSSLTSDSVISQMPWLKTRGLYDFFVLIKTIGSICFTFLPFMFAMAIPLGLASDNSGAAAFSGFIGYATILFIINFMINVLPVSLTGQNTFIGQATQEILGIKTMDIGVLGAILVGLAVYWMHEKFQYIALPNAISFWGGTRFVPIMSLLVFSVIGILMTFIWPAFNQLILWIGEGVKAVDWFGPFLYKFTESLVRPTGMHHVINTIVRFTAVGGEWTNPETGKTVVGALDIFYAQLALGIPVSADVTRFLSQGYMPTVMFGLPMGAIAIYVLAKTEQKKMVKSVIIPGIVASAVGGITEPIEFLFLFVSPLLYLIHCVLIGLAYMFVGLMQVKIGNTDGNVIDFVVFGIMQGTYTKWYLILLIGPLWGGIYFGLFYFYIKLRNVQVLGRTELSEEEKASLLNFDRSKKVTSFDKIALSYLQLLGGAENVKTLNNCYTRLRITLNKNVNISQEEVKELGAIGIKYVDDLNIQIIIGPQVEKLKNEIAKLIKE